MSRVLATFLMGGAVGFASNEAYNFFAKNTKTKELVKYDLQRKLSSNWNKTYEPTSWSWNWDGRDEAFLAAKKQEKSRKGDLTTIPEERGADVANKRDINNNIVAPKSHDKKSQQKLANATRHILLIRHGQYNTAGDNDAQHTLTKNGIEQAISTGKHLKQMQLPFTTLLSSTMTRANQTADLIQAQISPIERHTTHLLREGAPFPPEPPTSSWRPDDKFLEDGARIEEGFRTFFHRADVSQTKDSYEIVVCHANVIRYIVCRVLQLPPEAWLRMSLQHASITWISIRPSGRVVLRSLGDGGHIPLTLKTFS